MCFKKLELIEVFDSLEISLIVLCGLGQMWAPVRTNAMRQLSMRWEWWIVLHNDSPKRLRLWSCTRQEYHSTTSGQNTFMPQSPEKRHAMKVVRQLAKDYADAECALNFRTPYQLLIATILSAQCTDERVNIVTKSLFKEFPNANVWQRRLRNKLKSILRAPASFALKPKI